MYISIVSPLIDNTFYELQESTTGCFCELKNITGQIETQNSKVQFCFLKIVIKINYH